MQTIVNLYPPLTNTYEKAFLINSDDKEKNICKVYFSLSKYNNIEDIKNVQISISNQYTNLSVLNEDLYPSEIKIDNVKLDNSITTDYKYYIEIEPGDLKNNNFEYNQYYKIQLRFTSVYATNISLALPQAISNWLNENESYFSEWSTVCLVRGISQPIVTIQNLSPNIENYWDYSSTVDLIGRITYSYFAETEYLKNYRIKLYNSNNELLTDSGDIISNDYDTRNVINYTFKYNFSEGEDYYFTFSYTTQNLYSETLTYNIILVNDFTDILEAKLECIKDEENGRIGIRILGEYNAKDFIGDIVFKRCSSKTDFTIWEDLKIISVTKISNLDYVLYDYTIESGVFYKYSAQKKNNKGNCGTSIKTKEPISIIFDYSFLTTSDRQLKLKFDNNISSFKHNLSQSITTTLGSRYPFIRKNGNTDYIQFPITCLISANQDEDNIFTSKEEIYGQWKYLYDDYNELNGINKFYDYNYERKFRDLVLNWLNNNEVKLFRSPTEGNILIKITDVSLTPRQSLSRMLWEFSCTAYEIDECNFKNYEYYNIINKNNKTRIDNIERQSYSSIISCIGDDCLE